MKARNINDDNTLAYLFNKTRNAASSALEKAVEAINNTITTITTNMPQWINANISYVGGETIDDKIARLLSGDYLPRNKPFIGVVSSGSKYFTAGYLYVSSNKLYGSFIFSGYKGTNTSGGIYSVTADVVAKRSADMSEVVMKTGDTMTGALTLNSAGVVEKNTAYAIGDAPGSQSGVSITWTDKNNSQIGFVGAGWEADGKLFQQIGTNRTVNGTTKWHHVRQSIASDGTATVSFGQAAAWRAGLGLGSMATVNSPVPVANGGTGLTASPSMLTDLGSTTAANILTASPRPGITGTLAVGHGGTGRATITANAVLAGNTTSAVKMIATASGALFATAANGAASFGTLPIAQGGTGQTAVTKTTTATSIFTASSGVTIVDAAFAQWGKMATVRLTLKKNAAISANTQLGTMVSGKRPAIDATAWVATVTDHTAYITTDGKVYLNTNFGANLQFVLSSTFMLA